MKNEEIKEILKNIKRQNEWEGVEYFKTPLSNEDTDKLLDYITNLQQENEKLQITVNNCKQENDRLNNIINQFEEWLNDLGAWCYVEKLKELKGSVNNE